MGRRNLHAEPQMYNTIRATAHFTGISEKALRRMQKEGKLPGFICGQRYLVNYQEFLKSISSQNSEEAG